MESAVGECVPGGFGGVTGCIWFEEAKRASGGIDCFAKGNFWCNGFFVVNLKADGVEPVIASESVWCWIARMV